MKVTNVGTVTLLIVIVSGLLLFAAASCSVNREKTDAAGGASAADAAVNEAHAVKEAVTLNTYCQACHAGFEDDKLASRHKRAGIGCERCHGESERHRSDENNITPPEIMYPRARITPTCMMCHPRPTIDHVGRHDVILAGADTIFDESSDSSDEEERVCTDCHGRGHRMNVRTIRWDKATGEILK